MRVPVVLLAVFVAVAIVLVGCQKPADQGTGSAGPSTKTPSGKFGGKAPPAKVTLTDPDGQTLVLVPTKPDEEFLKGLGLTAYPGATPYALDVDATADAQIQAREKSGAKLTESERQSARELARSSFGVRNAFFETEDSLEDVRNWATENLKGWTIGDIKDKDGVKGFEITKVELQEKVACGVFEFSGKRYMMILEAKPEPSPESRAE